MSDDFFSADESETPATYEANEAAAKSRKRRRSRVIALVALGSVGALGIYSCASSQTDDTWQGADSGQVVDGAGSGTNADGTPVASRGYRPSIWPWMWFFSSNRGYGGGYGARAGQTSGFSGTSTASRGSAPTSSTSGTSTVGGTSRGGFGSIGKALSGLS